MSYGYTQAGQENSFTWKRMAKGFYHVSSGMPAIPFQRALACSRTLPDPVCG